MFVEFCVGRGVIVDDTCAYHVRWQRLSWQGYLSWQAYSTR